MGDSEAQGGEGLIVHNPALFNELASDSDNAGDSGGFMFATAVNAASKKNTHSTGGTSATATKSESVSPRKHQQQQTQRKRRLRHRPRGALKEADENACQGLSEELKSDFYEKLMQENADVVKKVDGVLILNDAQEQRRKHGLYKEWHENVFAPIQSGIDDEMRAHHTQCMRDKRRIFDSYLQNHNTKRGNVFLDVITKSEYDPLTMKKLSINHSIEAGTDPLRRGYEGDDESVFILESEEAAALAESLQLAGDHGHDPKAWLQTPMFDIDSYAHAHGRPSRRVNMAYNHSQIQLEPLNLVHPGKRHFDGKQQETGKYDFHPFVANEHPVIPQPPKRLR